MGAGRTHGTCHMCPTGGASNGLRRVPGMIALCMKGVCDLLRSVYTVSVVPRTSLGGHGRTARFVTGGQIVRWGVVRHKED